MAERMYGRSGQYTEKEWQDVIAMKRHEAQVHAAMQPAKDAIHQQLCQKLINAGVAAEKVEAVAKIVIANRLERIHWSSAAMRKAILAIQAWHEEAMEPITMMQIERNNNMHVWGQ